MRDNEYNTEVVAVKDPLSEVVLLPERLDDLLKVVVLDIELRPLGVTDNENDEEMVAVKDSLVDAVVLRLLDLEVLEVELAEEEKVSSRERLPAEWVACNDIDDDDVAVTDGVHDSGCELLDRDVVMEALAVPLWEPEGAVKLTEALFDVVADNDVDVERLCSFEAPSIVTVTKFDFDED